MILDDNKTLFVYSGALEEAGIAPEEKYAEISAYIDEVQMGNIVTVSIAPFDGTIVVIGPEDLLREIYTDCVYQGDEEGFDEGFQNSVD